jgi:serine/threonine-protein kinase
MTNSNVLEPYPKPHDSLNGSAGGGFPRTYEEGSRIGRYTLDARIAVGGMASVYLGRSTGAADFSRVVAIKRMHQPFSQDPEFVSRFRDEAWLCARLMHPNIVQILDVVEWREELLLIMEFVEGVTLRALRADASAAHADFPLPITLGILVSALHGLHAAHESTDDEGRSLGLVHRDFTPHNIMICRDGHAKVLDFGIAKARGQVHATSTGHFSGKLGYLSPEQIHCTELDRRADVFAAGVVLWETLTGERLFREEGVSDAGVLDRVLHKEIPPPSFRNPKVSQSIDAITLRALNRDPSARFPSARDFALALETALPPATPSQLADFVMRVSGARLARFAALHAEVRRCPMPPMQETTEWSQSSVESELEATALREPVFEPQLRSPRSAVWGITALGFLLVAALSYSYAHLRIGHRDSARFNSAASAPGVSRDLVPTTQAPIAPLQAPSSLSSSAILPRHEVEELAKVPSNSLRKSLAVTPAKPGGERSASRVVAPHVLESKQPASTGVGLQLSKSCSPPTYVDSEGIRHFKKGCL